MADPKQLITKQFAIDLNANYINERANIINTAIGYDDANAIWYSLEELESYITYIKTKAVEKEYTVNGIRFYLGVYPNQSVYEDKAGMTTLFLSPTGYKNQTPLPTNEADIDDIELLNFGSMGNPPQMVYPSS